MVIMTLNSKNFHYHGLKLCDQCNIWEKKYFEIDKIFCMLVQKNWKTNRFFANSLPAPRLLGWRDLPALIWKNRKTKVKQM